MTDFLQSVIDLIASDNIFAVITLAMVIVMLISREMARAMVHEVHGNARIHMVAMIESQAAMLDEIHMHSEVENEKPKRTMVRLGDDGELIEVEEMGNHGQIG